MDIVFSLCAAYERQEYMEGSKVGFGLMMELEEDQRLIGREETVRK